MKDKFKLRVSRRFISTLKSRCENDYEIAEMAGVHYSTLSRFINGVERLKVNDQRVLKVARVLGLAPEECFESKYLTKI